ncbi:MAG TPA: ABC transporter permease [Candidatus Dormibacteraeota bacterium]|nr:ABC transporter permease [Candidatus Dormibacteraeota bacterium]
MTLPEQVVRWFLDGQHWSGDFGVPHRIAEHLLMSAGSILAAAIIALPIGIWLGHIGKGGVLAINISNIGRAIPSFALLVLAVELVGIGWLPAFVALVALAIPPMVTNSYIGMGEVDADVREAARGIGMRQRAVLFRVELPIALPFIMAGIRTSAVNVVATATLAALVGWGGLGRFIIDGFSQRDDVQIIAGALIVAILSIAVEFGFTGLQRLAVPRGLRTREFIDKEVGTEPTAELSAA